jgi:hypothetical protein
MALLNPGYWPADYFPKEYWDPAYWPKFGAPGGLVPGDIIMDLEGIRYEVLADNRIRELA